MTTDQLAQLRAIAEQYTANAVRIDYREREIALAALPRLLEERGALLAALKLGEEVLADASGGRFHLTLAAMRAAIARAEGP